MESVTEIISASGLADYSWSSPEAMQRGSYVHAASQMIDRCTLDWSSLDPVLMPYCEAYRNFIEDLRPGIVLSEKPLYHPSQLWAGTMDRVLSLGGRTVVLDIKSGALHPANWIQVAAYRELVDENEKITITQGAILCLQDDGKYRLHTCNRTDLKTNLNIFMAALTICRWKKGAGI
jgi:hypothetical protein